MTRTARVLASVIATWLAAGAAHAAPNADLQNLKWFVVSGIGQGENLAFYQAVIDQAMADAKLLLQGDQGPADVPCCVDIRRLSAISITAPTLQAVDAGTDYDDMTTRCTQSGGGSCAFLVDTITFCGGFSPTAIGCADAPTCAENVPDDDPTLTLVVSLDALIDGSLAQTIAHERGHNACLSHVTATPCQIMRDAAGGGCLDAAECGHYRDAGNASGASCGCHTDALATVADETACVENATPGICSGGLCGEVGSDVSVRLFAAGALEFPAAGANDDPLLLSGLSGGWSDAGSLGAPLRDADWAESRSLLYGVTDADQLVTINPATGATLATIGTLPATGTSLLSATAVRYDGIAFAPGGAGSADDLLYAVRQAASCDDTDFCDSELVRIDPDDAAITFLGDVATSLMDGFQDLAFDTSRSRLYASGFAEGSLFELFPSCDYIGPQFCLALDVEEVVLPRIQSGLAYSAQTDRLYLVGTQVGDQVYYDSIDAADFSYPESIGIDGFGPGGLAALPAPEPLSAAGIAAAFAVLARWSRRRR